MMSEERMLVLDENKILQKIRRVSHEIYENNFKESELILAGIEGQGYTFASLIEKELKKLAPIKLTLVRITVEKSDPMHSDVEIDVDPSVANKKSMIIIDDVLNTGKTVLAAFKPFLNIRLKKVQTAFVVDRNHKQFPVSADFVGYSLSTTLKDHIEVNLEPGKMGVYLT